MLDFTDPKNYQKRWEELFAQWGNADRVNQQIQAELKYQKENPDKGAKGSLQNNQFIQEFLRNQINLTDPRFAQQRQQIFGDIGKTFQQQGLRAKENLAQAGLSRSGLGSVIASLLAGEKANAVANADVNIGNQEQQIRDRAIRNLLGLDRLNLSANLGQQGLNLREFGLGEQSRQFNSQMDWRKKNQGGWGSMIGSLLGTAAGAFAGGAGAAIGGKIGGAIGGAADKG